MTGIVDRQESNIDEMFEAVLESELNESADDLIRGMYDYYEKHGRLTPKQKSTLLAFYERL